MSIFDDISKSPQYQKYFSMLPEAQRHEAEVNLRKLCEEFEKKILLPLSILKK